MKTTPTRKQTRFLRTTTAALAAVFFALACGETAAPRTTKDDLDRDVALPPRIERIVTLTPNVTEMIFAIGAGAKIVGTDDFSDFPEAARKLAKVGGMQPNIERIAALRPDVVIASTEGNHPNLVPALSAARIPLFVVRTDRLAEVAVAMRRLGQILGAPQADAAASRLNAAVLGQRRMRTTPPRVLFAVWTDPLYVGGRGTFTDDLIEITGALNAVQVTGWPQYSLEALVASPPDLLLYPRGAVTPEQVRALQQRVPEMKAQIVEVDENIFQRPGPRVVEAARRLNDILDAWERGSSNKR
ncbi:MAG TPA: helical backbone metal receptor [Thermoanaerobaculia bacterium]|jgi:ABC-type Fe3+-hydroxamate transport system substrate-binding protein